MTTPQHIYQIYIKATVDQVWAAITEPEFTSQYFFQTAIDTSLEPGSGYRYLTPDGNPAAQGNLEIVEPGRRLVLTWLALYDADMAEEPPGRVEWLLSPANQEGTVTRVQVRHFDLGLSPLTWANVKDGWEAILDGMKTLLETGESLGQVDVPEPIEGSDVERAWHRSLAVRANNSSWKILGGTSEHDGLTLDPDQAFDLLGRAYAAAHHWRGFNGPSSINAARATWLCSRAHAVVGDGAAALRTAEHCQTLTAGASAEAADFDHFYAAEAKARALACLGQADDAHLAFEQARNLLAKLADPEDLKIAEGDLAGGPWFGFKPQTGNSEASDTS